jgi:hypothetical protein
VTTAAAMTATKSAVCCTGEATAMSGATETAVRSAGESAAMHAAAKTRLPARRKMACRAAMVKSTERAGTLTRRHVRRSKPAIGAVIDRSAA